MASNMTLQDVALRIHHPNLPPLRVYQMDRDENQMSLYSPSQYSTKNRIERYIQSLVRSFLDFHHHQFKSKLLKKHLLILRRVNGTSTKTFQVQCKWGRGKTLLLNTLISFLILQCKKVIDDLSSLIAATLVIDGATHFTFKIPFDITEMSKCDVPVDSKLTSTMFESEVVMWNEIAIVHKQYIEAAQIHWSERIFVWW